jgi:pseudouridine kinase
MKRESHVVVIGAINLDIKGRTARTMIPHTSNPGKVEVSQGGVGRNVAENLVKLQIRTSLISALADDFFSRFLLEQIKAAGISMEHVLISDLYPTGLFMAFMDHRGDLISAISDMSILSTLTPEYLKSREEIIQSADYIVLDADIPGNSMNFILDLAQKNDIPVCVEPVSVEKAALMLPFLDRITIVTPNREEAEVLAGFPIYEGAKGVVSVADAILAKGVKYVIITLGAEGVYLASEEDKRFIPSISTVVVDSVGAGDSLVAGTIYALCKGKSIYDAIRTGIASATLTLTTKKAVHPDLSPESLEQLIGQRNW